MININQQYYHNIKYINFTAIQLITLHIEIKLLFNNE